MKYKLLFILFCISLFCKSQSLVVDPALTTALSVQHYNENSAYNKIKDNQSEIKRYQVLIDAQLIQIKEIEKKTQKYLSTVNAVVKNGKDIIFASQIAKDISKYQSQAYELASGDPKLLTVCAKTEYALVSRSLDLLTYIYTLALKDGESNMLDNKQRTDMVIHVVKELRVMRGLAYAICRQIKAAKRDGIWRQLAPNQFRYAALTKRRVDKILNDAKWVSKGGKYR